MRSLPGLTDDARTVLLRRWTPERWAPLRTEAARVLDATERSELRDTEVAQARQRLSAQMAGELSDGERSLAAELIAPLLVPNSSFSATPDAAGARSRGGRGPARHREHRPGRGPRPGRHEDDRGRPRPASRRSGSTCSSLDLAAIGGWLLLSGLLVALLIAWLRLFRPEYWHRNNVVLLLWLLVALATFALQLTEGRAALPFILPDRGDRTCSSPSCSTRRRPSSSPRSSRSSPAP